MRTAALDDYPKIAALEFKYGLEVKSYEEWTHLWINNPAYRKYQESLPIGWVLEDDNSNIAGYLGNIPLFYELDGQRLLAAVAHSWVVDAQYRSYSLLLLEEYFSQKVVSVFLNATVGPAAIDSFGIFQSLPVPVGAWDRSAFWITNYRGFMTGWLAMKGYPLVKPLSYVLSLGLFLKRALTRPPLHNEQPGASLACSPHFDDRFDLFWESLRKSKPNVLLGVRTREALEWHFRYALLTNKAWIVTATDGATLIAYAIFRRYDNTKVGLTRMRLVDYQSLHENPAILLSMLYWGLRRCRAERIHMMEAIGFRPEKWDIICRTRPEERRLPSWLYFYQTRDRILAEKLRGTDAWDPSQFDGDASL